MHTVANKSIIDRLLQQTKPVSDLSLHSDKITCIILILGTLKKMRTVSLLIIFIEKIC